MILHKCLGLLLAVVLVLTGCDDTPAGKVLRYDLSAGVTNLDPQFATNESARMLISNTMEGLFRQTADGRVEPGMAETYDVSSDGLTYTFHLRKNAQWRDRKGELTPVTAHDFVFALRRIFSPNAPSPFAAYLLNIRNAAAVMEGSMPISALSVFAPEDYTLEIVLHQPDASLPTVLAGSWAMPCNEAFFIGTKARYGLDLTCLQFNGPFYIRTWNNEQIVSLRRNNAYYKSTVALGVDFPIPSAIAKTDDNYVTDPVERFFSGVTHASAIPASAVEGAKTQGASLTAFSSTVWMLAMNQADPSLSVPELRRAIGYSLNRAAISDGFGEHQQPTQVLLPPSIPMGDDTYRNEAGTSSPQSYSQDLAARSIGAFRQNHAAPTSMELICADDNAQRLLAGYIQRYLQQNLGISIRLTPLPAAEVEKRVSARNYRLALYSLTPAYPSPDALLSAFTTNSDSNFTAYQNSLYDDLVSTAATLPLDKQVRAYSDAEQLLLTDAVVVPLYFETTYYAAAPQVTEIDFSPFLSGMRFS